jgi:hypothetical protein
LVGSTYHPKIQNHSFFNLKSPNLLLDNKSSQSL